MARRITVFIGKRYDGQYQAVIGSMIEAIGPTKEDVIKTIEERYPDRIIEVIEIAEG